MPIPSFKEQVAALVATPSVSSSRAEWDQSNGPVVELLAGWLADLGFACEIQPVAPGKFNLVASLGSGPGGLILAGHTDTVPFDEALWQTDPLRLSERGDRWIGLGLCDMKVFFALAIEALRALHGQPLRRPLIILATCDEETSMAGARALVARGQPQARAAVIGEPTGLRPVRLHKGFMAERVDILGRSGHSSNPALGHSALEAMHSAISELMALRADWQREFRDPLFEVPYPTLNLGCIHGGDNPNRICGQCSLEFDLRALPGMATEPLRALIAQRLQRVAERHSVRIDYRPLVEETPAFEQSATGELVQLAERLSGHGAGVAAFCTEAPFLQRLGGEVVVLGAGDIDCAHQPDEYLSTDRIEPMLRILRELIGHYCCQ